MDKVNANPPFFKQTLTLPNSLFLQKSCMKILHLLSIKNVLTSGVHHGNANL